MFNFKTTLAAAAMMALPMTVSAATIELNYDISLGQDGYSFSQTVSPGDDVVFTFHVTEALNIPGFALTGGGTNNGKDIKSATWQIKNPDGGPQGFFDIKTNFGTSTGTTIFEGQEYAAGEVFQVMFKHASEKSVSYSVSFPVEAIVAAVPVPAAGLLLLSALGGVAALRRRRKSA